MRIITAMITSFLLLFGANIYASDMHHDHHEMTVTKTHESYQAVGVIKSIDGSDIEIHHEPIKSLQWPEMDMFFQLAHSVSLNGIDVGSKVNFTFHEQDGNYMITAVSKR
ncbi:copper-binding protein [Cysteiniphilum halobium]|uniref:copper-binding protein n=1 Tax=Cysteiniphilum halobium TaxID=2219059 RepID=UPI000E651B74|nr:copper-binding protein [Cysteiniphilum halobium]